MYIVGCMKSDLSVYFVAVRLCVICLVVLLGVVVSLWVVMSVNLQWLGVTLSLCHSVFSGWGLRLWVMMPVRLRHCAAVSV